MRFALVFLALASATTIACEDRDPLPTPVSEEDVIRAPRIGIESIVENPRRHEGQTARIDGEVERVLNPRAFVLTDEDAFSEHTIVVLTREPAEPLGIALQPGDRVIAKGIVRTYDVTTYERELGRDLEREVEAAMGGKPVIVARDVGRVRADHIDWM